MQRPKPISSQCFYRGRIIQVYSERLLYPDGREYDIDLVRHPGAAAMVAVDDRSRVCLVRQYRHGVEDFLWEIPAGKLDAGEAPEVCAVRELAEEAGVTAGRWTALGLYYPAPGLFTELIYLFLAQDLKLSAPDPDSDEELELQWLPLEDAIELTLNGAINDGKTALALARARYHLRAVSS